MSLFLLVLGGNILCGKDLVCLFFFFLGGVGWGGGVGGWGGGKRGIHLSKVLRASRSLPKPCAQTLQGMNCQLPVGLVTNKHVGFSFGVISNPFHLMGSG